MSMTKEYPITIVAGHILFDDDRGTCLLVDTGSPFSFHSDAVIEIGDDTFSVPKSLTGVTADYISDKVGERIDGLVGMNILAELGVLIDVPHGRLVFGHPTDGMKKIPSRCGVAYLTAEMDIRGRRTKVIIDTGAPTSYVDPSLTEGLDPVGRVEDFNPLVPGDVFETPVYEFPASFDGHGFTMRAGHLPSILQMAVSIIGISGVVGMELLKWQPLLINSEGIWIQQGI